MFTEQNLFFYIKSNLGNNNKIYFRIRSHFQLFAFDWKRILVRWMGKK